MNSIISPDETARLNTLWSNVRQRIDTVETPADFLIPAEPMPVPVEMPLEEPVETTCFESAGEGLHEHLFTAIECEQSLVHTYTCMASRLPNRRATRLFAMLKTRQIMLTRRLVSACYLLTGQRLPPSKKMPCKPSDDWLLDVRALFFQETKATTQYQQAGLIGDDTCLRELFEYAYNTKRETADTLRKLLEEIL
ncbi:MAG: hypothetical protein FWE06_06100 [Oscillospiraceae bacterium]|nr:hypothetical protein [Oscillospiraceae bacterium]